MIRVIVICEGETERDFCKTILAPYFLKRGILIHAPLIKKSRGGIVKWAVLKKQILLHLKNEPDVYVTTFIDYYGLYAGYRFPNWDEAEAQPDKYERMAILERGMKEEIEDALRYRFLPYIQLHEFEGLLFNDIEIFHDNIPTRDIVGMAELTSTFDEYENPEMINNNRETSPSHRLVRIIKGYNKIVYGVILAEAIGLEQMRSKSPHFDEWLMEIEQLIAN